MCLFSDILEGNNDYSDTLDFRRGWMEQVGLVTFFVLEVSDYKSAMLIYSVLPDVAVLRQIGHFLMLMAAKK